MTLHVSEIFHSIQGEGALAGMPSTFIRLAHCNLTCSWCDAAYTWKGNVAYEERTIADVVEQVQHRHVVVTGGEPTFAQGFDDLVGLLNHELDAHVTVETNGTLWREDALPHVSLWSVSPKLGSSAQAPMLDMDVLSRYAHELDRAFVQWKFVIDNEDDFGAALDLLRELNIGDDDRQVFMQPNGLCHIAQLSNALGVQSTDTRRADGPVDDAVLETPYLDRVRWLYELVVAADAAGDLPCPVRAVPQSHKLAWGNRRGF